MAEIDTTRAGTSERKGTIVLPHTTVGKWGLAFTVLALSGFVVLPMITTAFRETYPITDSWVMPVILLVLNDVAAVLNGFALFRARERSLLGIIAAIVTIAAGLFVTAFVVGEGIAGA